MNEFIHNINPPENLGIILRSIRDMYGKLSDGSYTLPYIKLSIYGYAAGDKLERKLDNQPINGVDIPADKRTFSLLLNNKGVFQGLQPYKYFEKYDLTITTNWTEAKEQHEPYHILLVPRAERYTTDRGSRIQTLFSNITRK